MSHESRLRQLQDALKQKRGWDAERKQLQYSLGSLYEEMGERELAIQQFKAIYEEDIGYRDVANKIDAYWESK
jgi:lipoprotein NlpI